MKSTNTGGPAFPIVVGDQLTQGMTLRDYFAAKALQGIIASWTTGHPPADSAVAASYQYADAMLKARGA